MIYHLLDIGVYPQKYLEFIIRNKKSFNLSNHHFVLLTNGKNLFSSDILGEINYSVTKKGWDVYRYLRAAKKSDKIIVHCLGNPRHLIFFSIFPNRLKNVVWSIWGGDAYFVQYLKESWVYYIYELLRKRIIPYIPLITCVVKGDYDFVTQNYNSTAQYMKSIYPSDINDGFFTSFCASNDSKKTSVGKSILIGNSADPSNRHLEVIRALKRYRNEIDEIKVPLMYGGSHEYVSKVINQGKNIFGDKFKGLTRYMSSAEYVKILDSTNVQILNHYRQQGLGNTFVMLALKKRIFIRGDISSFSYFKSLGIQIQDTRSILSGDTRLFDDNQTIAEKNKKLILQETSETHLVELWKNVFDAETQ